jgi:hypothetical protein
MLHFAVLLWMAVSLQPAHRDLFVYILLKSQMILILLRDFKLQLVDAKRVAGAGPYELQGEERLGTSLIISPIDKNGPDLSKCNIQWHRVSVDGAKGGPVTGVYCV